MASRKITTEDKERIGEYLKKVIETEFKNLKVFPRGFLIASRNTKPFFGGFRWHYDEYDERERTTVQNIVSSKTNFYIRATIPVDSLKSPPTIVRTEMGPLRERALQGIPNHITLFFIGATLHAPPITNSTAPSEGLVIYDIECSFTY